ncbi:hypothetical protein [Thermofilum sp.]|uniref:hypothetical protein n=1 Tax=Thermofilum sp. TaxID=1961369 RepID=UPI00317AA638
MFHHVLFATLEEAQFVVRFAINIIAVVVFFKTSNMACVQLVANLVEWYGISVTEVWQSARHINPL